MARGAGRRARRGRVEAIAEQSAHIATPRSGNCNGTLGDTRDFAAAAQQVRALMFIERFADDIDRRLEALGQ